MQYPNGINVLHGSFLSYKRASAKASKCVNRCNTCDRCNSYRCNRCNAIERKIFIGFDYSVNVPVSCGH